MKKGILAGLAFLFLIAIAPCAKAGEPRRTVDDTPCDARATKAARSVLAYIASLSTGNANAAIAGQNCGHGSQIAEAANMMGYAAIMGDIAAKTKRYPGILGVDYEHDRIFTAEELDRCNAVLIDWWNKGGLVTINWSPQSPWLNDEVDLAKNPGSWSNTRNEGANLKGVDLDDLVDPSKPVHAIWHRKLDRVAAALGELQDSGVVVLWRPLQEMNGFWFWWGSAGAGGDGERYRRVWRDMYDYLTNEKGLHNILWVYSPCDRGSNPSADVKGAAWGYPGDEYVDIVAGTAYNDELAFADYGEYLAFGKPIAMAEYGAASWKNKAHTGSLDNRLYAQTIRKRYPAIAYWVCWHNWANGDGTSSWHSLNRNRFASECLERADVITRDELPDF